MKNRKMFKITAAAVMLVISFAIFMSGGSNYAHAVSDNDAELAQEIAEYMSEVVSEERGKLRAISDEQQILALIYLTDEIEVRAEASDDSETVVTIFSGQTVFIEDAEIEPLDEYYNMWELWLYVSLCYNNEEYRGYVPSGNVVTSDERFIQWKANSGLDPVTQVAQYSLEEGAVIDYSDVEQFPESYQTALRELKEAHPDWIFVPMNTNIDWDTAIENEIGEGKSLVHSSLADCMKEGSYDNGSWYFASEAALKYYMDPRNSLTEDAIFQFEQLTYNESYHTEAAVDTFLSNTFMNNSQNAPGTDMTFAKIFWAIGSEMNVSPFHLASRVYQEQGQGTSALISGTYSGYEG